MRRERWAKGEKRLTFFLNVCRTQVLPLERVIKCVQDTLAEIAHIDDMESGVLRQKYLLHFLYKYISRYNLYIRTLHYYIILHTHTLKGNFFVQILYHSTATRYNVV